MNKRISLFAFLFILCLAVRCQTRNVRHYTINEGLANNAVYSMSQDMKGRMWFGTIDGVHSFDGMNAHRIGKDFKRESVRLNKRDKLKIHLAPGGGFAIRLQ